MWADEFEQCHAHVHIHHHGMDSATADEHLVISYMAVVESEQSTLPISSKHVGILPALHTHT